MLDVRFDSIVYQSKVALASQVDQLVTQKINGKAKLNQWSKILLIRRYLKALEFVNHFTPDEQTDFIYILECLIKLTGINSFPAAPYLGVIQVPNILVGSPGATGATGPQGVQGPTGLATDINAGSLVSATAVDTFALTLAPGARWDYTAFNTSGNQRSGSIIGTWNTSGSAIDWNDSATPDIIGSTAGVEFSVILNGSNIQLIANVSTGSWSVRASRYFIPNNGNGSGPVGSTLLNGYMYVGNASNVATGVLPSGALTISNLGVTTLNAGVVQNSNIATLAGLSVSKLAAQASSTVAVYDSSGFLTSSVASSLLTYLTGLTGNIQSQINSVGIPSLTASRAVVSNGSGVLVSNAALTTNTVTKWNGTQFANSLITDDGTNVVLGGAVSLGTHNLSANGFKITGLAIATAASDAVRFDQISSLTPGAWTVLTALNGWTASAKYRIFNGYVELRGTVNGSSATGVAIFVLPNATTSSASFAYSFFATVSNSSTTTKSIEVDAVINTSSSVMTCPFYATAAGSLNYNLDGIKYSIV